MYFKCKKCERVCHLNFGFSGMTDEKWIEKYAPNTKPDEIPEFICLLCRSGTDEDVVKNG